MNIVGTPAFASCQFQRHVRIDDDFTPYLRNGSVYPSAFLDAVCCGYAASEQPGYAAYPVHILFSLVGCGLGWLRFASLQGVPVQEYELFARHLPYGL